MSTIHSRDQNIKSPIFCKPAEVIEFYMTTANIERTLEEYLRNNREILDPKTRIFISNIHAIVGALSNKLKKLSIDDHTLHRS